MAKIVLSGMAQLLVNNILLASRTRGRVEFLVVDGLRNMIFPEECQKMAQQPGQPGVFNVQRLKSLPDREIELKPAEREAFLKALEAYEQDEAGPGITVENGAWFYPLVESLKE